MKIAVIKRHKPDNFRIDLARVKRKASRPVRKVIIIADLNDRAIFPRVHQFRTDCNRFAVHSRIEIKDHMLVTWNGVTYKVASIDRMEVGTLYGSEYYYEIKCLLFPRLQNSES